MANRRIVEDGMNTRFTSENQPPNRGRKPKLYTVAKKSYGITLDEFRDVVNYLWQLPKGEVKEITEREDTPIWVANVCRALLKDTARGTLNALRELMQLMFGKELAAKIEVELPAARPMTVEEAKKIISELA